MSTNVYKMANIRLSDAFFGLLKKNQKHGESIERTILKSNMTKMDRELSKIFKDQDARRKSKFKKK